MSTQKFTASLSSELLASANNQLVSSRYLRGEFLLFDIDTLTAATHLSPVSGQERMLWGGWRFPEVKTGPCLFSHPIC